MKTYLPYVKKWSLVITEEDTFLKVIYNGNFTVIYNRLSYNNR